MRLGLGLGYAGARVHVDVAGCAGGGPARLPLGVDGRGVRLRRGDPAGVDRRADHRIHVGTAIMQMPARTPAMTAMTAMTLDQLSGGRFLLGLGVSGPQVVEGWHGVPSASRWRGRASTSRSCARSGAREAARARGRALPDPVRGRRRHRPRQAAQEHPARPRRIPIYLAAIGPKSVAHAAEIADGWLPIFFSPSARRRRSASRSRRASREAGGGKRSRTSTSRRRCRWSSATTSQACRAAGQAAARALHRRHGRARQELLQRSRLPLRLRGGGRRGSRTSTWPARRRRRRPRCPTRSPTRSRCAARGAHPRPPRGVARERRDHADLRDDPDRGAAVDGRAGALKPAGPSRRRRVSSRRPRAGSRPGSGEAPSARSEEAAGLLEVAVPLQLRSQGLERSTSRRRVAADRDQLDQDLRALSPPAGLRGVAPGIRMGELAPLDLVAQALGTLAEGGSGHGRGAGRAAAAARFGGRRRRRRRRQAFIAALAVVAALAAGRGAALDGLLAAFFVAERFPVFFATVLSSSSRHFGGGSSPVAGFPLQGRTARPEGAPDDTAQTPRERTAGIRDIRQEASRRAEPRGRRGRPRTATWPGPSSSRTPRERRTRSRRPSHRRTNRRSPARQAARNDGRPACAFRGSTSSTKPSHTKPKVHGRTAAGRNSGTVTKATPTSHREAEPDRQGHRLPRRGRRGQGPRPQQRGRLEERGPDRGEGPGVRDGGDPGGLGHPEIRPVPEARVVALEEEPERDRERSP